MTIRSAPVLLVLGTDPGPEFDATATRRFAAALTRAADTADARLVHHVGDALTAEFDTAAQTARHRAFSASDDVVAQAAELAGPHRVVVVLLAGDTATARLLLGDRARGWSILAVAGTGGLAEQLTTAPQAKPAVQVVEGDDLARLQERHAVAVAADDRLGYRIAWELDDYDVVKRILTRNLSYDLTAGKLQRAGNHVGVGILVLGVIAVFLAVLDRQLDAGGSVHDVFRWVLIVLPAVVAALVAVDGVTGAGRRWVLIRSACEQIKREIFVWRTRSGPYSSAALAARPEPASATEVLVDQVASIEADMLSSMVAAGTTFVPVADGWVDSGAADDGLSRLDADHYLHLRLDDQLSWYRGKLVKKQSQRRVYHTFAIVAGAAGSILATAEQTIWLPVAFAIGTALGAYAKQRQLDATILGYSRAAADLVQIRTRWDARPKSRHTRAEFEQLVADVEGALAREQGSWSAQMKVGLEAAAPTPGDLDHAEAPTMPEAPEIDLPRVEPAASEPA